MDNLDRDGFFEADIIPLFRDARNAAFGQHLGPINMKTLKKIRQTALRISTDVINELPDNPYAEGLSRRMIDSTFIMTNKPMIAWGPDDIVEGINLGMTPYDLTEDDVMTVMDVVAHTLMQLKAKRLVSAQLVTPDVLTDLTFQVKQGIAEMMAPEEDDVPDTEPMPSFAQMMVDEAMAAGINPLTDKEAFLAFANSPERIEQRRQAFDVNLQDEAFNEPTAFANSLMDWQLSNQELVDTGIDSPIVRGYWQSFGTYRLGAVRRPDRTLDVALLMADIDVNNVREYLLFANTWVAMIKQFSGRRTATKDARQFVEQLNQFASVNNQVTWQGERVVLVDPLGTDLRDIPVIRLSSGKNLRSKTVKQAKTENVAASYTNVINGLMAELRTDFELDKLILSTLELILTRFAGVAANKWHRNAKNMTAAVLLDSMANELSDKKLNLTEQFFVPVALETYAEYAHDNGEITEDAMFKWFDAIEDFEPHHMAQLINRAVVDTKVTLPL
ncbi:hypothetical protein KGP40_10605 [Weissella cibaria]|uniref:hypothetical protein n=1 Tax=Weissella cibaria TaxID=137591 RepID=UPI001C1F3B8F|nr:hypothetical protein [Weissella cibaria]MBU7562359.1 hypothetical protein [Weissella cibaria]